MFNRIKNLFFLNKLDFCGDHEYLNKNDILNIKNLISKEDYALIEKFEKKFSKLIGNGNAISYGSGRMGLYEILNYLKIKKGDEIIINSGTCSVMVNAILKFKAKPIFSDVDTNTYGSSSSNILKKITKKTKLIIAQHSFGIPCEIKKISSISKKKKIFLLEDCALSLSSKVNKTTLGNFGNASLFSTDHSKPINTFCGGLIYSKNQKLINYLKINKKNMQELNLFKKKNMFAYILFRRKLHASKFLLKKIYINFLFRIGIKLCNKNPYLNGDYYAKSLIQDYPYPCKFPSFLAYIGILEIKKWQTTLKKRKKIFKYFINNLAPKYPFLKKKIRLYNHVSQEIIPLRLVWHDPNSKIILKKLSNLIDISNIWFKKPIEATNKNLRSFNYKMKTCKNSEMIGPMMINLPCNINYIEAKKITNILLNNEK
jgi:perosamine synthetase|tara:strand:+ start:377 stop:1660 length:1284 start_codon:yes stop_codon:yes gene_type:complete